MKSLIEIHEKIQKILRENNCYISSEMGFEDDEDFPYLVRRCGELIEKIGVNG